MMKLTTIAIALAVALAGEASAGSTTTSKVAQVGVIPSTNIVWVKMAGPITNPAACAALGFFAISISTDAGKTVYRTLLAGQVQGLPVTVYGTGQCTASGGSEDIQYVWFDPPI